MTISRSPGTYHLWDKGTFRLRVHAQKLGQQDPEIYAFIHRAFDYLTGKPESAEALLALAMECGRINLRTMEILDGANTVLTFIPNQPESG